MSKPQDSSYKKIVMIVVFSFVALVFILKLLHIQVVDHQYKRFANINAIKRIVQHPARGYIFDRNGELLVFNDISFDLQVIPREVKEFDTLALAQELGIDAQIITKNINSILEKAGRQLPWSQPTPLIKEVTKSAAASLQEKIYKYKGFYLEPRIQRTYPKPIAAHLLGYIGEVDEKKVKEDAYYQAGDYIGINGLEKTYEKELRGIKGVKKIFVDVHNNPQGPYMDGQFDTTAIPGENLTTGIDITLQEYGEKLLQNKRGALVAIEPSTGEILALVSSPTYDPNLLSGGAKRINYPKLVMDENKPLYNRAVMDGYPPGSTFKMLNGLIGLQLGVITPQTTFPCLGGFIAGGLRVGCHAHGGPVDMKYSVKTSCNAYYCNVFRLILQNDKNINKAYEVWRRYINSFGLGVVMETDVSGLKSGLVPTAEYYNRIHKTDKWKALYIISLAIGQGELKVNVLQLANMMAAIANKGYYIDPHLVRKIGKENTIGDRFKKREIDIDKKYFELVIDALWGVVNAGGTGTIARVEGLDICGKTGTAQNPHGKDHSVFVAFAPKDNPKISIAVFVENSGFGATWAAPIASLMIEKYLRGKISRPWLEERMLNGNLMK